VVCHRVMLQCPGLGSGIRECCRCCCWRGEGASFDLFWGVVLSCYHCHVWISAVCCIVATRRLDCSIGLHQLHAVVHSGFKVLAFALFQSRLNTERPGVLAGAAQNLAHRRLCCSSALLFLATYDARPCAVYPVIVERSRYCWNPDSLYSS
jgi:hypothetical protein